MLSSYNKFERMNDPDQAISLALQFAKENNLHLEYGSVGSILKTSTCRISDDAGKITEGRGKGLGSQSLASAIFEALEHYYYTFEDVSSYGELTKLDLEQADKGLIHASPDFEAVLSRQPVPLRRLNFRQIDSPETKLSFPAVLMNPDYQSTDELEQIDFINHRLRRYSTNSGTASGTSVYETILHGLLETIERDAIGVELLRTVIRPDGFPVREIDLSSLPAEVRNVYESACAESKGSVKLWDITTEIGIPTILSALSVGENEEFRFFGSGSSLRADYAAERAILESVQGYHTQHLFKIPFQSPVKLSIDQMTLYQRCNLDEGYFFYRWGSRMVDFGAIKSPVEPDSSLSAEKQVSIIVNILRDLSMKVYYRNIYKGDIHVSQVLVPGLERFYLVSHGIPVAPSFRGRGVLKHERSGR